MPDDDSSNEDLPDISLKINPDEIHRAFRNQMYFKLCLELQFDKNQFICAIGTEYGLNEQIIVFLTALTEAHFMGYKMPNKLCINFIKILTKVNVLTLLRTGG